MFLILGNLVMNSSDSVTIAVNDRANQAGFSLVELMVAITLGLLVLAGLTTIFVNNSNTRNEIERANRQTENGRYAMQLLSDDLRNAGYLAEFDPRILSTPATKPDACATAVSDLKAALPLHVQGYDNGASLPCLSDLRSGTDILVLRRASTCVAGSADCAAVASGTPYFQASLCSSATELSSDNSSNYYALDTNTASLTRHKRDCSTLADFHRYRTHIYFIADNDNSGDGIPTLKRAELGSSGFTIVPLVEGIENLQIEYGIDTNNDGVPDAFTANPDSYNSCTGVACVDNWRSVVAVKLHLLARNTEQSAGYTDNKTYTLGLNADGSVYTTTPGGAYKRHAYQAQVRLNNPAGRRVTP